MRHEILVELFRKGRALAPFLLERALGKTLPRYDDIEVGEATWSEILPTEYRADLVVVLRRNDEPVYVIVVEIQLRRKPIKRFVWPAYATSLFAKHHCPVDVLVVTPYDSVARWAAQPVSIGHSGSAFVPLVLGFASVPRVSSTQALRFPELAVLCALAHHDDPVTGPEAVTTALRALGPLDEEPAAIYYDFIWASLSDAQRKELEAMLDRAKYEYQSDFAKKYFAEGKAEGNAEGEARGRAEGRMEGEVRGRAEGLRTALFIQLETRFGSVAASVASKIHQADAETLQHWLRRAPSADSPEQLLE